MSSVKQKQYDWRIVWDVAGKDSVPFLNYKFKIWDPLKEGYGYSSAYEFESISFGGGLRRAKRKARRLSKKLVAKAAKERAERAQKEAYNKKAEIRKGEEVFQVMLKED